jgi:hypothetical protein
MHILRILAILGRGDQTGSEGMYEVLGDVMRKADTGINVGYAIGERVREKEGERERGREEEGKSIE